MCVSSDSRSMRRDRTGLYLDRRRQSEGDVGKRSRYHYAKKPRLLQEYMEFGVARFPRLAIEMASTPRSPFSFRAATGQDRDPIRRVRVQPGEQRGGQRIAFAFALRLAKVRNGFRGRRSGS